MHRTFPLVWRLVFNLCTGISAAAFTKFSKRYWHGATGLQDAISVVGELERQKQAEPWIYQPTPDGAFNFIRPGQLYGQPRFDFYNRMNDSLSSRCLSAFYSSWTEFKANNSTQPMTAASLHSYNRGGLVTRWPFTAKPPCCEECLVGSDRVEIFYWPQAASNISVSTLTNAAGFSL